LAIPLSLALPTNLVGRAYSRAVFRVQTRLASTLAPPAGLWVQFASFGSWNLSPLVPRGARELVWIPTMGTGWNRSLPSSAPVRRW